MRYSLGIKDNQLFSTRRVEALTDGVFAIAMTLLVLDLHVGDLGHVTSSGQLWDVLANQQASIISFVISFLMLGSMWAVHMRQFEYITKADRHFVMLNTLRLLVVVLFPLSTSIAGNYQDLILGRVILPINFFILALISYWQWNYAVRPDKKLYDKDKLNDEAMSFSKTRNKAILILSAVVAVASIWLGEAAFALLFLTPFLMKRLKEPG